MRSQDRSTYRQAAEQAAQLLGIPSYGPNLDEEIVRHCTEQVSRWAEEHGQPADTAALAEMVAAALDVDLYEIHDEADLAKLMERIPPTIEPIMAQVATELDHETHAITIRRTKRQPWERSYLAIINCQGEHYARRFFSKWHELAHRFVEGEQLRFAFRRTTSRAEAKDPAEALVDKVAGALAYHPQIVGQYVERELQVGGLTFDAVELIRDQAAPEGSLTSSIFAVLSLTPYPAWFIRCSMGLTQAEQRLLEQPGNTTHPERRLRTTHVSANHHASKAGVRFHQNMRVPSDSAASRSKASGTGTRGYESLDEWETSSSGPIGQGEVFIDTRLYGDEVWALISMPE